MTRLPLRRYAADGFALTYVGAYYAWLFTRTPGTPLTNVIADLAFYPLGLVVGWACLRNARLAALDRRTRLAWAALGGQALLLWLIGITWPNLVHYFGPGAWPWWIGKVEVTQHLLLLSGLLLFPGRRVAPRERTRLGLDVALLLVAGFVLAFHFGLRVSLRHPPVGPIEVAVAQSALDWVVFAAAAVGVLHKRDTTSRGVMAFLVVASTLYLVGNYTLAGMEHYRLGDRVDGVWFCAWVFRWTAARFAWHRYREAAAGRGDVRAARPVETPETPLEYQGGIFSYVMVAGAFTLLVAQVLVGDRQFLWVLAFSATLMAALLVLRQVAELRENRRLFESQLAQQARFRSLVQHSSDVVVIVGPDRCLSYVSPSADSVFGPGVVTVGSYLPDLLAPADATVLEPLFAPAPPRQAGGRLQARMTAPGGRWLDVEIVWTDMRTDPLVGGVVLNCRDVTERNELERQLHHAQKLDAVGHLAGGLAHDFNNVLTAIRGYTELLRDELPPAARAREDLGHIEHAVDRAADVTKKLLAFSRKQPVQPAVLDLNAVLVDLQPLLRQLLTQRVEVALHTADGLWPVKADQGQMEQIIINLLTNACDAMPDGGLIDISTANRTLQAPSPQTGGLLPGDYVVLAVRDQGVGMTDEVRQRIFEPFFSTKPKDRGMGLGLAMVHGIVRHSGGHIAVESAPGHGTLFTILLPRTLDRRVPEPLDQPRARSAARTILLVDDEEAVRAIARRMLERAGHRVIEAARGEDALQVVADDGQPLDVLLTDMVMPGLHGLELIERARHLRPDLPIVCMTGFAGEGLDEQGTNHGITGVVAKPFAADTLRRAVAAACDAGSRS